jgi:type IV pilus biogenesis/stability protein PilW
MMNIRKALQSAVESYQAGNLSKAEHICREIIKGDKTNVEAHFYLGRVLHAEGRLEDAVVCYQRVIEVDRSFAAAYNAIGNIYQSKGLLDEAGASYQKAIDLNPEVAVAYNNLANVLQEKARFDEAVRHYEKALQLDPHLHIARRNLARAYSSLGYIYKERAGRNRAIDYYLRSLQTDPGLVDAYYNLGVLYQEEGQLEEALECYREIIRHDPAHADALNAIGSIFQKEGNLDEAESYYRKALGINPGIPEVLNNIGTILREKGRLDEAAEYYRRALQANPAFAVALNNIGTVERDKGQLAEAEIHYRKAIELNPDFSEAHWNMAFTYLLGGNFEDGWKEYEWRWKIQDHYLQNISQPLWDGSDIAGRTILIHAEQGFGDTIQFIRYAPLIKQRGPKVIVACQRELAGLLKSVKHIARVVTYGGSLPEFDFHCPLLRLPLIFNTTLETIPSAVPYVSADPQSVIRWREKVRNDGAKFRIGLAWAGRPSHINDRNRSCPLEMFLPVTGIDGIIVYSLQKREYAERAQYRSKDIRLTDLTEEIHDFSDTAALIGNLDLVVSVDTAVAHLAGALGKPVWTLIPYSPDWRWLLDREDSPWYPTMSLFRQSSPRDWRSVIDRVASELHKKIE